MKIRLIKKIACIILVIIALIHCYNKKQDAQRAIDKAVSESVERGEMSADLYRLINEK